MNVNEKTREVLIVVDMQGDFIDGSLGTAEAQKIVPFVKAKIDKYHRLAKEDPRKADIIYTQDTHFDDYFDTLEGKMLPVGHCKKDTEGWKIPDELDHSEYDHLLKKTFGYIKWDEYIDRGITGKIIVIGLCTDICVLSNVTILRAMFPNTEIVVDAKCCAGVTPEKHKAALEVMRSIQVTVINDEEDVA